MRPARCRATRALPGARLPAGRPLAETMQATQWYVAVDDRTVGPVTTDLLLAGLEHGRVPRTARVCPVGVILKKKLGFQKPIGSRDFDPAPISTKPHPDIEGA